MLVTKRNLETHVKVKWTCWGQRSARFPALRQAGDCTVYIFFLHGKLPKLKWWFGTLGAVFDYLAIQSKAVMLLSHLDRIPWGGNTCSCVCCIQSRHGNLDLIRETGKEQRGREMGVCSSVWLHLKYVPPFSSLLSLSVLMHTVLCVSTSGAPVSSRRIKFSWKPTRSV